MANIGYIQVVRHCNHFCGFCSNPTTPYVHTFETMKVLVDDLVVHGIWKTRSGYVAQIRATDNKSYLIRAGDLLYDGEVTRVGPNEVSFRQNLNDPQSVKPFREVTKQLNATVKQ